MILVICAVRDAAMDAFMPPFAVATPAVAIRSFADAVQSGDASNGMSKHPNDFELFKIGLYDDAAGSIESMTPTSLARASDYVNPG